MALKRRNKIYYIHFTAPNGRRIRVSAKTENKNAAEELEARLKTEAWQQVKLGKKATYLWQDAVTRWLKEKTHKASLKTDKSLFRWLDPHLRNIPLHQITRGLLDNVIEERLKNKSSNRTINATIGLIRALLRKCVNEWEWLDKMPAIRLLPQNNARLRWITREEADKLINQLPPHLAAMVRFTLSTGLRMSTVTGLEWTQIDFERRVAYIRPKQIKSRRPFTPPLNGDALAVLREQRGQHAKYVFVYKEKRIIQCNTKAFKKALKRAEISDFCWHDLRHTWASWHIQQGTPINILQELGDWKSIQMVLRYAHLNPSHLAQYADKLAHPRLIKDDTKLAQSK